MKTTRLPFAGFLTVFLLTVGGAISVCVGADSATAQQTFTGVVTDVKVPEKVLQARGLLFSKSFVVGDDCVLTLATRKSGTLGDFHTGQKVTVSYRNVHGILVAGSVAEDPQSFAGQVTVLNLPGHSLEVQHGVTTKVFALPDACVVELSNDEKGGLNRLELGAQVTVYYEEPGGRWTAKRIEQTSLRFTGTLATLDVPNRTVTVTKKLIPDRSFHLAGDCAVVVNGKISHRIGNLEPGKSYEMSYSVVDGVNIVNRITPASAPVAADEPR